MKIIINEPASSLQEIIIENIDKDEIPVLESLLEILELQHDYWQVHKYYTNKCNELLIFDRLRKNES